MKEFIEKLIGRLEELFCGEYNTDYIEKDEVLRTINELAEEYINTSNDTLSDYCEWKWGPDYAQVQCMGDKILFGSRRMFTYCPYYGKEIKAE